MFFLTVTGSTMILTLIGIIAEKKLNTNLMIIYFDLSIYYIFFVIYFIKIKSSILEIRNILFSSAVSFFYGLNIFILPFFK